MQNRPQQRETRNAAAPWMHASSPCGFCGRSLHLHSECPARRATCNKCGKKGHFAVVCRASKQLSVVELGAVCSNSEERAKFVDIKVDGTPLRFKVDSGAEVTVVPSTFSGIPPYLEPPEGELSGPAGQPLDVLGTFTATLQWKNKSATQRLYVLRSQVMPLLGFPAIQELGVVKFVDPVVETQGNQTASDKLFCGLGELQEAYTIRLKPDAVPYSLLVPRRVPIPLHGVVKAELDRLEAEGVIRRVTKPTPWCAGMVVVPKASGSYRICVDLTKLNQVVLRERHILPTVDQVLGLLGNAQVFSKLDAIKFSSSKTGRRV
ncbi:uncharacterized protein LOC119376955 [Rhipicephalus sanguineus]|uniref:uncharacterized protein LOC119376955 n=1 Tax=Rhipicephalus sanguineus TaxID=34632 RepID=UPI00189360D7|nr:uncharacterized protein LOC119376955 [Rhipicephalus sanguineus]